jgi:hypothetical protein
MSSRLAALNTIGASGLPRERHTWACSSLSSLSSHTAR